VGLTVTDAGAAVGGLMTGLPPGWAVGWMTAAAAAVSEHRAELNTLDRAIGDGDHGENLDRGFSAVVEKLGQAADTHPGPVLKLAAMTLMSTVGGAAGPLYGTAFLRAATALGESGEPGPDRVVAFLAAARDGVVARGKAEPGDKTMIDAWTPAVDAAAAAAASAGDAQQVLAAAAGAARAGASATEPLVARKGRASYLGERSAGHLDPGAVSTALILQAAAEAAAGAAEAVAEAGDATEGSA
jgi:dihydroxyacetone kinase-like protein